MEKIHKVLTVDNKDVRKAEWTNKEVNTSICFHPIFSFAFCVMKKSVLLE